MGTNKRLGVKKRKANGRNSFLHQVFFCSSFFPSWTWCFTPVKGLIFRHGAPRRRGRPEIRRVGRGASLPASPCFFVLGHHAPEHSSRSGREFGEADVVLHPRQSLDPSLRGTTSPRPAGNSAGRMWCFPSVKGLILRLGAPRCRGWPGIWRAERGASPPSKP